MYIYDIYVRNFFKLVRKIIIIYIICIYNIYSHSMGTLIAVMALNKINNLKAVIFSSPPFKSGTIHYYHIIINNITLSSSSPPTLSSTAASLLPIIIIITYHDHHHHHLRSSSPLSSSSSSSFLLYTGPGVSSPFGFRCLYPITQTSVAITLTSLLASIDPSGAAAPLLQEEITSDINDLMKLKKDKRMGPNYVTNKSAYEVLKLVDNSKLEIKNIKIPVLIIHGSIDQISLLEGSQYLYDNIDNSNNSSSDESNNSNSSDSYNDDKNSGNNNKDKNKQIIVIPEGKHELLHEVTEIKTYAMNIVINYIENQFNNSLTKKE